MTKILQNEKKTISVPAEQKKPAEKTACDKCGCQDLWESIYSDGILRCNTCEPAPSPDIIGRRVGPWIELDLSEEQPTVNELPIGIDPADRFVEYRTACGRQGMALRGYDIPSHANYNQRVCAYVSIGVAAYDRYLDELQAELREALVKV